MVNDNLEKVEYNQRQIMLIEQKIKDFIENKIYINWLIHDLESLITCIKDSSKWVKDFGDKIWELEQIYAFALEDNKQNFTEDEMNEINKILSQMKSLVTDYKSKYL